VGCWANGVSIFGASDGTSYNNQNTRFFRFSSALAFELYDLDVWGGHAVNEEYHYHQNSHFIQERMHLSLGITAQRDMTFSLPFTAGCMMETQCMYCLSHSHCLLEASRVLHKQCHGMWRDKHTTHLCAH
jgi:hypothetical protein